MVDELWTKTAANLAQNNVHERFKSHASLSDLLLEPLSRRVKDNRHDKYRQEPSAMLYNLTVIHSSTLGG